MVRKYMLLLTMALSSVMYVLGMDFDAKKDYFWEKFGSYFMDEQNKTILRKILHSDGVYRYSQGYRQLKIA